jgi:hypothetical protein
MHFCKHSLVSGWFAESFTELLHHSQFYKCLSLFAAAAHKIFGYSSTAPSEKEVESAIVAGLRGASDRLVGRPERKMRSDAPALTVAKATRRSNGARRTDSGRRRTDTLSDVDDEEED